MHYEAISDWTAPLSHANIDSEMAAASIFVMNLALQQRNPLIRDTMVAEFSKANPNYSGQSLCFYPPKTSSKRHPVWKLCRFFRVDVFPTNLPYGVSITKAKGTKCWQMTSEDLRFRAENFCTREFFPKMKHQLCHKPLGRRMQTGRWQGPMRSNRCLAAKCLQLFFFYFEAVSRNRMKRSISMNNSRNV